MFLQIKTPFAMLKTYDEKEQILAFRATVMLYPTRAKKRQDSQVRQAGSGEEAWTHSGQG